MARKSRQVEVQAHLRHSVTLAPLILCLVAASLAVYAPSALARAHLGGLVQQVLKARRPHVLNGQTEVLNAGQRGQIINVDIAVGALPADAEGVLKDVVQYAVMFKDPNGDTHPFSRFWENGKYILDRAGAIQVSNHRPPGDSPDTALKPGEKALLDIRESVERLSTGKVVAEANFQHGIRNGGKRIRRRHVGPKPRLSWNLPYTASEGTSIPFSWVGHDLGGQDRLVIQRPEGTGHTWRTILRLSAHSGSADLPSLTLGKYRLRLADLSGRRVLASKVAGIAVFGQVPFSTLMEGDNWRDEVYAAPQFSFPFVSEWEGLAGENPAFQVKHNHCAFVHIAFAPGYDEAKGVGTITLVQESRDAVTASAPFEAIGTLDTELTPGQSWAVNASYMSDFAPQIYFNGYAICDSTESFFAS